MKRIKAERISRGWTHADLGRIARVVRPDISRIECGHLIPYGAVAKRLAAALGIQPEELADDVRMAGPGGAKFLYRLTPDMVKAVAGLGDGPE